MDTNNTNSNLLKAPEDRQLKDCRCGCAPYEGKARGLTIFGIILGVSLLASAFIVSNTFYQIKNLDNTLLVTGSAKKQITSDVVKWTAVFTRTIPVTNLKSGYDQMAKDLIQVIKFFKDEGIEEKDLVVSPVFMDQSYYDYNKSSNQPQQYVLRQTIELQSSDVSKVTALAKNTQKLIDSGVIFSTQSLEYYYSKLPEARVDLLSEAISDAKDRANKIAESSGKKLGNLKSASMGVVQVMPMNSTDVSDYGTYDTSQVEKEVMITVKAVFTLK